MNRIKWTEFSGIFFYQKRIQVNRFFSGIIMIYKTRINVDIINTWAMFVLDLYPVLVLASAKIQNRKYIIRMAFIWAWTNFFFFKFLFYFYLIQNMKSKSPIRHLQNFAAVGHGLPGFVPGGSEQTGALLRWYTGTLVRNNKNNDWNMYNSCVVTNFWGFFFYYFKE